MRWFAPVVRLVCAHARGRIPAKQGCRIRIQQVGICGDADRSSGSVGFTVQGAGGASFGFEAGQNSKGTQIRLPATQRVSGYGARYGGYHKFSETEQKNKYTYAVGKAVNIRSLGTNDGGPCPMLLMGPTRRVGRAAAQHASKTICLQRLVLSSGVVRCCLPARTVALWLA